MAVIHLFDSRKQHKRLVRRGVQEIIHNEGEYNATAQLMSKDAPAYGDHFGFRCADGRFRIFLINDIEITDRTNTCTVTGTDAAIAELDGKVLETLGLNDTTAKEAAREALKGTGWSLGTLTGDGAVKAADAYFTTVWTVMKTISAAARVRVVPYFEFADGEIVGRKVDILDRTPVFRGLIYTRKKGAQNIHIIKEGVPYGRVFPVGRITGSGNPPERVTIADVEWTTAAGKPVNKPKGQKYIDLPGAISTAEYVYQDNREEDPEKLAEKALEDLESKQQAHATGTAVIGDMSRRPGYAMRAPELWELVVIRTEEGDSAEATVTNVERYYVHEELTKLHIGEENEATFEEYIAKLSEESAENASAAGGAGAGARENKQLILKAEELIQLNAERIELNAQEILLRATITQVQELENSTETQFNEVYIDLDALEASIELKASQQSVDSLANRVTTNESAIELNKANIALKASQTVVDALGTRVTQAEIDIDGVESQITLKANKVVVDGILSAGLTGVTTLSASTVSGNNMYCDHLTINDEQVLTRSATLMKTATLSRSTTSIRDFYGDTHTVVSGVSLDIDYETIVYLST